MEAWDTFLALPVTTLRARLVPRGTFVPEDRWWASTVRGGLGQSLRFLLCRCRGRVHATGCLFARLFAPAAEEGHEPVMLPPWRLAVVTQDSELEVTLWLFGEASQYTDAFLLALQNAAFRGLGRQRFATVLAERAHTALQELAAGPWDPGLTLEFRSPVRLQAHGALVTAGPSFLQVFSSAQRKVRLAARSWCSVELPFPSDHIHLARRISVARAAVRWVEMARYSHRQQQFMRLGGLQGSVQFTGEWSFAWPWLRFLPAVGLGKLTTMGFGDVAWTRASET